MAWHWNMHTRPSCCIFLGGKPTTVPKDWCRKKWTDDWMIYILFSVYLSRKCVDADVLVWNIFFWEGVSHPISWMKFLPCGAFCSPFKFPNTAVPGASNLHGEGSTATLLSPAPRTAESTSGRDCNTRGDDLLADCSMSFSASFHGSGKKPVDFPWMSRRIHALSNEFAHWELQQERHYFEESNTKIFDGL